MKRQNKIDIVDYDILKDAFDKLQVDYDIFDRENLHGAMKNVDMALVLENVVYFYFDIKGNYIDYETKFV